MQKKQSRVEWTSYGILKCRGEAVNVVIDPNKQPERRIIDPNKQPERRITIVRVLSTMISIDHKI